MLIKTKGVVINHIKYKESSVITKIFTEELGLRTYIVNSVRSKKSKVALFQPLTLLDLVVYEKNGAGINRLNEYKLNVSNPNLSDNMIKLSIGMFISEVLSYTVKEEDENRLLYKFIETAVEELGRAKKNVFNFHLIFLYQLLPYLGFRLTNPHEIFTKKVIGTEINFLQIETLLKTNYDNNLEISYSERKFTLEMMVNFYQSQIEGIGKFKSMDILQEVLS